MVERAAKDGEEEIVAYRLFAETPVGEGLMRLVKWKRGPRCVGDQDTSAMELIKRGLRDGHLVSVPETTEDVMNALKELRERAKTIVGRRFNPRTQKTVIDTGVGTRTQDGGFVE